MLGKLAIFALLAFWATPARADTKGYLCEITGAASCPGYGTYQPPPQYHEPRERPERCIPCEEEAERELEYNILHMQHPVEAPTLAGDHVAILNEDVEAANAVMEGIDVALEGVLAAPALEAALTVGVTLIALDAAVSLAAIAFPDYVHVPVWLNGLSLVRSAAETIEKTCEKLLSAARGACADLPTETCSSDDDCRTMLDKWKKRLPCDRAWLDVRKGQCPTKGSDSDPMEQNADEVKRCGRMISGKPECCPPDVRTEKDTACKKNQPSGCQEQLVMTLGAIMSLNAEDRAPHCRTAVQNRADMERCRAAREAEKSQCYEGQLDAGHTDQLLDVTEHVNGCDSFIEAARYVGICQ